MHNPPWSFGSEKHHPNGVTTVEERQAIMRVNLCLSRRNQQALALLHKKLKICCGWPIMLWEVWITCEQPGSCRPCNVQLFGGCIYPAADWLETGRCMMRLK